MKYFVILSALATFSLSSCVTTEQEAGNDVKVEATESAPQAPVSAYYLPMP
jgi:predicted small secreted protein